MAERTTPGIRVALTIAGSDPSGGAGIQADLKTLAAMDVYGAAVLTSLTAQNTTGVKGIFHVPAAFVDQQIDAVAGDIKVNAAKIGMLGTKEIAEVVAKAVSRHSLFPLVLDPVMVAKSGDSLIDDGAVQVIRKKFVPLAAVVTPNKAEAVRLLGSSKKIEDVYGAIEVASQICMQLGARACIVKGVKQPNDQEGNAVDVLAFRDDGGHVHTKEITAEWRPTSNTHGSGCVFSAAIAGALALGQPLDQAVQTAKNVVTEAIRQQTDIGHGNHPVNHLAYLKVKK